MVPMIEADFTEATDTLPPGEYAARVVNSEVRTSKTSGGTYINWTLETFGKDDERFNGRKIFHSTPTTGKGAGILRQFLNATAVETTGQFETTDLHGRELVVVIVEDKESTYPRVKTVKRYNTSAAA